MAERGVEVTKTVGRSKESKRVKNTALAGHLEASHEDNEPSPCVCESVTRRRQ